MYINGPNISPSEFVKMTPGEGEIPVSFTLEPNWKAPALPKDYCTGRSHFDEERKISRTPSKYMHSRLKLCRDLFAANPQCIFHALLKEMLLQAQFILHKGNNFKVQSM